MGEMTRQEFTEFYCANSKMTPEAMARHKVFLPCNCDDSNCLGWAAVHRNRGSIEHHMQYSMSDDVSLALEALGELEGEPS